MPKYEYLTFNKISKYHRRRQLPRIMNLSKYYANFVDTHCSECLLRVFTILRTTMTISYTFASLLLLLLAI